MKTMTTAALKTPLFRQGDSLVEFILQNVPTDLVEEEMVLAITSKIVSLAENRVIPVNSTDKKTLTKNESEFFLGEIGFNVSLSIKHSLLLPAAGIDESNSEQGDYILHPADPHQSARHIWQELRRHWNLQHLGVILTDSRSSPLRLGVTGVALSCAGFKPVLDRVGDQDLFGRPLKITKVNMADSLATAAVLLMGEADEACPLAILKHTPVEFCQDFDLQTWQLSPSEDMYLPLYQHLIKKS